MNKKVSHYNVTNHPDYSEYGTFQDVPKSRRMIPPEVLRKMAKASKEGGRATCEVCKETFAMYYIKLVKITAFKSGHVCLDCQTEHRYQVLR